MKKTLLIVTGFLLYFSQITIKAQNIYTIAGNGTAGYSGDGGAAVAAELNNPYGVAVDNAGNVYVADYANYRIRKVNTGGIIKTFAGNGSAGYTGNGGPATAAELGEPGGVATDGSGNVYFSEQGNYSYRQVTAAGIINGFVSPGNNCTGTCSCGDGGLSTIADVWGVQGVAADNSGNAYVSSFDTYTIRRVSIGSGVINHFAGSKGATAGSCSSSCYSGVSGSTGDGGPATAATLIEPIGVAADAAGNVYIADAGSNRIRMVNTNGIISTIAGNGTAGYSGNGGPATAAELNTPYGVTVDALGNIYIADMGNNRIRKITGGIISTYAGNGTAGFSGDGGPAILAELHNPYGVATDASGDLFIADMSNNRIREVTTGSPLPVNLMYFNCDASSENIILNWATASENNNSYFTIERSGDDNDFLPVARIEGTGNSSSAHTYSYTDNEPLSGDNYYKLSQTDYDGKTVYLNITECNPVNDNLHIYPNPSSGKISVVLPSTFANQEYSVNVTDLLGKLVYSSNEQGVQSLTLDLSNLPSAIYILKVISANKTYIKKIIIAR